MRPMRYRSDSKYLFQTIPEAKEPPRIIGSAYERDTYGPTHEHLDPYVGWPWDVPGGDWIDRNGVRQGTVPWFSCPLNAVSGSTAVADYSFDVTDAMGRYYAAFRMDTFGAPRVIAALKSSTPPYVEVVYSDGTKGVLPCRLTAVCSSGSSVPNTMAEKMTLPIFIEFEQPDRPYEKATMHIRIVGHWSGKSELRGWKLAPTFNADPVRYGVASQYPMDDGLEKDPSIIGVHRYTDGSSLSDFVLPDKINHGAEREFDPAIWGGTSDLSKLPHRGLGKFINPGKDWSLVKSTDIDSLAPGLGALRVRMPATPGIQDGSLVGYTGTAAADAFIFLPEHLFGRARRIFVRHYFRLDGENYQPDIKDRLHVYQSQKADGTLYAPAWTDAGGKFGIMPGQKTSYGGNSGSAGGGCGHQFRLSWSDCDAGMGGPDEGGWSAGYHLYDFWVNQPAGYSYYGDKGRKTKFGQRGGLGGILYANQWYGMENEVVLNTATPEGFKADGELRTWIDGRLVFERTGMVFRTLPVLSKPYDPTKLRPCRELGHTGLWFNWFHGGKTKNVKDRTIDITGLAWGTEYIGPMKL